MPEHAAQLRAAVETFDEQVSDLLTQWLVHREGLPATDAASAVDRLFLDRMAARALEPHDAMGILNEAVTIGEGFAGDGDDTALWVAVTRARGELALNTSQVVEDEEAQVALDQACEAAALLEEHGPATEAAAAWRLIAPFTESPVEVLRRASELDGEEPSQWACLGLLTLAGALLDGEQESDLPEAEEAVRRAQAMALRPGFVRSVAIRLELDTARARLAGHQGDFEKAVTLASRALYLPIGEEKLLATIPTRMLLLDLLLYTRQFDRADTEIEALRDIARPREDDNLLALADQYTAAVQQARG